jgi:hypothetical protein
VPIASSRLPRSACYTRSAVESGRGGSGQATKRLPVSTYPTL